MNKEIKEDLIDVWNWTVDRVCYIFIAMIFLTAIMSIMKVIIEFIESNP